MRFRFADVISKWTISSDCKTSTFENVLAWVKKAQPVVIYSNKPNPVKDPPEEKGK